MEFQDDMAPGLDPAPPRVMVKYCWVVVSDYGLNGVHVHGVYTTEPDAEMVKRFVDAQAVTPDGFHYRISGTTGYGGTEILMFQLDGMLT